MRNILRKTIPWILFAQVLAGACSDPPTTPPENPPIPQPNPVGGTSPTTRPIALAPLPEPDRIVSVFFTADVEAHLEPCGCSKDPLGGVDRLAGYLSAARARPKFAGDLFLDAGDLLFEKNEISLDREAQLDKAALIASIWSKLGISAVLTGPRDIPKNGPNLTDPALAVLPRLRADDPQKRRLVKEVGGLKFGVFASASLESGAPTSKDPLATAKEDIAALTAEGATQIIALSYGGYAFAEQLAALGGLHFVINASGDSERLAISEKDIPTPKEKNGAVILTAFSQGQTVGEIEFRIKDGDTSFTDGGAPARAQQSAEAVARRMEPLAKKAKEAAAQGLDASSLTRSLEKLSREYEELAKAAEAPIEGSHIVARVTVLSSAIKNDPQMAVLKEDFVVKQGEKFKALALKEILPAPKAGEASYVGAAACKDCHDEEYKFWQKTPHAHALETLVSKQRDGQPECVACHVAGFRKPGGTTLVSRVAELGGVQCENCHGPGSLHVDALGGEKPSSMIGMTPEATCRGCHYPPHTNEFKFQERISKIVGPGHMFTEKK